MATLKERHLLEQKRIDAQRERIENQKKTENKRAALGHMRGEKTTGIDELERRKVSAESRWTGKWNRRRARRERRQ